MVENYPTKKQRNFQQPEFKPPDSSSCEQKNWIEIDKSSFCPGCEFIKNKQKQQTDKKNLGKGINISTRLPYTDKKIRDLCFDMVTIKFDTLQNVIKKLQELEGKPKMKL